MDGDGYISNSIKELPWGSMQYQVCVIYNDLGVTVLLLHR